MDKAVNADPSRFELRSERWLMMAKSGVKEIAEQTLRELDAARHNLEYRSNWEPFLFSLAESYAKSLKAAGQPMGKLNVFAPELANDEIGRIVARLKKDER